MSTQTKQEAKHTPTPYTVQRLNHAGGETWVQIGFMDDGREIGPLAELVGGAVKHDVPAWHPVAVMKYLVAPDEQVLANAEFIVRACNSHDELLKALKRAAQFISNGVEFGYITMPDADTPDPAHETLPLIRAAIAKAEGY